MRFAVITHVKHIHKDNQWLAYAPYVREMNLWFNYVEAVEVVAPKTNGTVTDIDEIYQHKNITFSQVPDIEFTSLKKSLQSTLKLPMILLSIFKACKRADHIHLRCPGNMGLLGSLIQMLFPKTPKTAKYAGNWDPKSKQPLSYRFQKWLLSNTVLTKNMQVLVYGNWTNQSKNIKPFFTATYYNHEKEALVKKDYSKTLKMVFIGSLVPGKQPLFCVQLIEQLRALELDIQLDIYGEGVLRPELERYIQECELTGKVTLHGNVDKSRLKQVYKNSHFVVLPSLSEGWPKALAEGMFFGVIPIATSVSCVPWMLDSGRRGIVIPNDVNKAVQVVKNQIKNANLQAMSVAAQQWSHHYTMDDFESAIKSLLDVS